MRCLAHSMPKKTKAKNQKITKEKSSNPRRREMMLSKAQSPKIKLESKLKINRLRMKPRKCKRNTKRK